jgi:lysine-N-methylase
MENSGKPDFYNSFQCTADQCPFTCCRGWDILVDTETLDRWKKNEEQSLQVQKSIKVKKCGKETKHFINMGSQKCCPFLNDKGLCNLVIQSGEDELPKTCRTFPRQENSFKGYKEYSLSCACPAVVDLIHEIKGKIEFKYCGEDRKESVTSNGSKIRKVMMDIIQNVKAPLMDRFLLVFHMLLFLREEKLDTEMVLNRYRDESYLLALIEIWRDAPAVDEDSLAETKELFLDIVMNYKKEKNYRKYLNEISVLAEKTEIADTCSLWEEFKQIFKEYDYLIENYITAKIFSGCVSDTIDELTISYQMIVTEYILVRYSVFLKWLQQSKKADYTELRDYIVIYSRIIDYNTEGILEFWEDSFDEAIWEFGYMLLLIQ